MRPSVRELLFLHFMNDGVRTTFTVLLVVIATDLHLDLTLVGFLGSTQPLFGALLALPSGYLLSKLGGPRLLVHLIAIYSVAALTMSMANNALILTAAFLLGAIGFGMFHTIGFASVALLSVAKNIGKNLGSFTAIGEVGRISLPPLALYIATFIGWRITMGVIAALGFAVYILLLRSPLTRSQNATKLKQDGKRNYLGHTIRMLRSGRVIATITASVIDTLASNGMHIFLPFLLVYKGFGGVEISFVMAMLFVGSFAGKSTLGALSDTRGRRLVFIVSEVALAASLLAIVSSFALVYITLLSFLLGVFTKGTSPIIQAMFSDLTDEKHYNKIFAIAEVCIGAASFIGLIGMGYLADVFGISVVFYIASGLSLAAIAPIFLLSSVGRRFL